jgi:hypothetical protein
MRRFVFLMFVMLVATVLVYTVAWSQSDQPQRVPISFILLDEDGNDFAPGWIVDCVVILDDPDDRLDMVARSCCCGSEEPAPDTFATLVTVTSRPANTSVPPTAVISTPFPTATFDPTPFPRPTADPEPRER